MCPPGLPKSSEAEPRECTSGTAYFTSALCGVATEITSQKQGVLAELSVQTAVVEHDRRTKGCLCLTATESQQDQLDPAPPRVTSHRRNEGAVAYFRGQRSSLGLFKEVGRGDSCCFLKRSDAVLGVTCPGSHHSQELVFPKQILFQSD